MEQSTAKEKIFKQIRNALIEKSDLSNQNIDLNQNVFHTTEDSNEIFFAKNLIQANGKFIFCDDLAELNQNIASLLKQNNWKHVIAIEPEVQDNLKSIQQLLELDMNNLENCDAAITGCECLVARFGSVMVSSTQLKSRRLFAYTPVHIVVAHTSQVLLELNHAFDFIKSKYKNKLPSQITNITGPSRTADIEKTLIMGAHGPKELYVFLYDKKN